MNLDLINNLFNNLKENKFVQDFIKELSNYLETSLTNNEWNDLFSDDLTLYNNKITTKFRNEMLAERAIILQKYAENTKEAGEMYYIYNKSESNSYNLCNCEINKSHEVITETTKKLPEGTNLGSVLKKIDDKFILDIDATKIINEKINNMIKEKIEEQNNYLSSKRIDGHIYEVGEKYSDTILLYDLNSTVDGGSEGFEEIEFPKTLLVSLTEGDKVRYENGEYNVYS